jgi:hypothetical protein
MFSYVCKTPEPEMFWQSATSKIKESVEKSNTEDFLIGGRRKRISRKKNRRKSHKK